MIWLINLCLMLIIEHKVRRENCLFSMSFVYHSLYIIHCIHADICIMTIVKGGRVPPDYLVFEGWIINYSLIIFPTLAAGTPRYLPWQWSMNGLWIICDLIFQGKWISWWEIQYLLMCTRLWSPVLHFFPTHSILWKSCMFFTSCI